MACVLPWDRDSSHVGQMKYLLLTTLQLYIKLKHRVSKGTFLICCPPFHLLPLCFLLLFWQRPVLKILLTWFSQGFVDWRNINVEEIYSQLYSYLFIICWSELSIYLLYLFTCVYTPISHLKYDSFCWHCQKGNNPTLCFLSMVVVGLCCHHVCK